MLGADDDPETVAAAYEAGANTYIVKPVTFLALVRLMKVFTAYWLETAELPPGQAASAMAAPLDPLRVLAVSADDARHAPVRALLRSRQIEHVDDARAGARRRVTSDRHDIVLVDREIEPPGTDGLRSRGELVRRPRRRR